MGGAEQHMRTAMVWALIAPTVRPRRATRSRRSLYRKEPKCYIPMRMMPDIAQPGPPTTYGVFHC